MNARIDSLRLVGEFGTNKVMAAELTRLSRRALGGLRLPRPARAGTGALVYPLAELGGRDARHLAALALHYHRTSTRVLWDLYASRARRLEPLYRELRAAVAADERGIVRAGAAISARARNVGAFAAGERQIVGAVKNAIADGARDRGIELRVDPRAPDLPIAIRMHDDELTVSLDLAGGSRSWRGYRAEGGEAPLRETLAAALVMLARHDPRREALVDPMAGSGTLAIEAALMARAEPLYRGRDRPAACGIPGFAARDLGLGNEPLFSDTEPAVLAADVDPGAVTRARRAARGAGAEIEIAQADFRDLGPERVERALGDRAERGVILSNPPYGVRLSASDDLRALYRDLGAFCRQFPGWRAAFVAASDDFAPAFGGRPRVEKPLRAGGLRARFLLYDL